MRGRWQIAEPRRRKPKPEPRIYVSLNARGEIAMNAEAFWQIDEPVRVTLMYNAKRRTIGVKYSVGADEHFFRVRGYGRGRRMRIVRAGRLLKQFDIPLDRTLVFTDIEIIEHKGARMLLLELDAAAPLTPRPKPHRKGGLATHGRSLTIREG